MQSKHTRRYIERSSLAITMGNRRYTRLTNAFSKKVENHAHHLALHFTYYNYTRQHQNLRIGPAMAVGISDHLWSVEEIAGLRWLGVAAATIGSFVPSEIISAERGSRAISGEPVECGAS